MRIFILILFLLTLISAHSQIDWKNYSTSFNGGKSATLGVAIPYNGMYSNIDGTIVGIAHWNPQYRISIDAALNDSIPLYFVYDTAGIYFLAPQVNKKNTKQFEYCVLLNNKKAITSWTHIDAFTETAVGDMNAGRGIMGSYNVKQAEYLVVHLRNKGGKIISSWVVYYKSESPRIASLYTSNSPQEFSQILNNKDHFGGGPAEIGWHRQYNNISKKQDGVLKLSYNESSILVNIDAKIYKKEALGYAILFNGKTIREWGPGEYDNNYILLKNLDPGNYTIRIRYKRQENSITELKFSIASVWYKTATFKVAILTFLVLALAFLLFILKYRKQKAALRHLKKKAELSAEELKNIHSLLNPHFTFNALSSIQGLVNKGDLDAANKYLSSFGELLRETLKESKTQHLPLSKELENLKIYIELERLRYSFTYNLHIDQNIDLYSTTIPPFLLQPFVENAIKHGFSKMNGQGELNLNIDKDGDDMLVRITDNGGGFDKTDFKEGYGLSLSKSRIELINGEYGEELIKLQIESTGSGASILLFFKNWL
ncbi:MAG: sensor histidine kinase [Chitinophagaceae bacterium]